MAQKIEIKVSITAATPFQFQVLDGMISVFLSVLKSHAESHHRRNAVAYSIDYPQNIPTGRRFQKKPDGGTV